MNTATKLRFAHRALVIDDDHDVCLLFQSELEKAGFETDYAVSTAEAFNRLKTRSYDLILIDLHLGSENAIEKMPQILKEAPMTRVWVLTAQSSIESAVQAMRAGASGFFSKEQGPVTIVNELKAAYFSLENRRDSIYSSLGEECGLLGKSSSIQAVLQNIERMRDVASTVLIYGESGTGKELIAKALHKVSPLRNGPFAAINCGAIPETLVESERFGPNRGCFTEATTRPTRYFDQ